MKVSFKNKLVTFLFLALCLPLPILQAQRATDYTIKKISIEFITTPDFQFTGTQRRSEDIGKWMEIETEFESIPQFTEELTFKYYVQINKIVFIGEVTHVDIAAGKALFSVMYISPRSISRIMEGKNLTASSIEKVSVEITKQGALLSSGSWKNEKPGWWTSSPQKPGFLRNKGETPFAPLYWDRYEAIKSNIR